MNICTCARLGRALLLASVLAVGSVWLVGCDDEGGGSNPAGGGGKDTGGDIEGTWVTHVEGIEMKTVIGNGVFTGYSAGMLINKGTYTVDGNKLTTKVTHIHGEGYASLGLGFEPTWYTVDQYMELPMIKMLLAVNDEMVNNNLAELYKEQTATFNVSGDKLTITNKDGTKTVYTRK